MLKAAPIPQDKVFVALSKRVALSLWVVAAFPQIYEYFSKGRGDATFGYSVSDDKPDRPMCYATYVYPTWTVRILLTIRPFIMMYSFYRARVVKYK